jgi:hypothetical protein
VRTSKPSAPCAAGDRALLDGGAPRQPVAGQQDLRQPGRVDAPRGRDREVAPAPRVANVQDARVAAGRVGYAVEDEVRQGREARLGGQRLAERADHLHVPLLGVERVDGALELAPLRLELLGVGAQLAALCLELVVRGLERLGHLVERARHRAELAPPLLRAAHARRAVAAGQAPGGGGDAPDRHDDRAPDVDAVERVEQRGQEQPADGQRDGAADRGAGLALAVRGVGAQPGANGRELLADVVHTALALAGGHAAAGLGQRAAGGRDHGRDPSRHVRVDVRDERVEDRALVVRGQPRAHDARLLRDVSLCGDRRLEELPPAGDHETAHPGLRIDHVALEVGHRLRRAEEVLRARIGVVGRADGADEQREDGDLKRREDDRGERDLARERAGMGRVGRVHRGRS